MANALIWWVIMHNKNARDIADRYLGCMVELPWSHQHLIRRRNHRPGTLGNHSSPGGYSQEDRSIQRLSISSGVSDPHWLLACRRFELTKLVQRGYCDHLSTGLCEGYKRIGRSNMGYMGRGGFYPDDPGIEHHHCLFTPVQTVP